MTVFIDWIISQGFHGIAIRETVPGEPPIDTRYKVAKSEFVGMKDDGTCWRGRLTVTESSVLGLEHTERNITCRFVIPPDEYNRLVNEFGGLKDTPEYYQEKIEAEKRRREARVKDKAAYEKMRPECPRCGEKMVVQKTSSMTRVWGCPRYPICKATRDIRPDVLTRLRSLGFL